MRNFSGRLAGAGVALLATAVLTACSGQDEPAADTSSQDAIYAEIVQDDPEYAANHIPCWYWPESRQKECGERGGDTKFRPGQTLSSSTRPTGTPDEQACERLPNKFQIMACYGELDENGNRPQ